MTYDPRLHHRRSIRLEGYDYRSAGGYFITLATFDRSDLFGTISSGVMHLSPVGEIVESTWRWLGEQYPYIELDEWVVMPNHFHAILWILADDTRDPSCRGGSRTAPTQNPPAADDTRDPSGPGRSGPGGSRTAPTKIKSLGSLIGAFKTISTKQINLVRTTPGVIAWQRNFYEHIIRDSSSLDNIRAYILNNPQNWDLDQENTQRLSSPVPGIV